MFKKIRRDSLEKFLSAHSTDMRVLDIGGSRTLGHSYDHYFPNRVTIDIDPERKPDVVGDAHQLPFGDQEFEAVVCTEVLEHLTDPPRALAEMHRVLKVGGKLILTTPFVYPMHDTPHDYFRFTKFGLEYLLRDWKDVVVMPSTPTFTSLGVLLQRITFQSDMRGGKLTKGFLLLFAYVCTKLDWLIKREYGNIMRSTKPIESILASGYQVTAQK